MIDVSFQGCAVFVCLLVVASAAGLLTSRCLSWTETARAARLNLWVGLGLGPFFAGLATVLALGMLPGASHLVHLSFVLAVLAAVAAVAAMFGKGVEAPAPTGAGFTKTGIALVVMVALWACVLLVNAVLLPLFQNDSLEYATVGRLLFEKRALSYYPAIDPGVSQSGFYGPWTHPPLYVALIYLGQIIQGHADAPGLMRLIAPWFALAGAGVVYGVGRMVDRTTGAAAALVFLSTPLFMLGADSGLIDALPVLGFALMIAALVGTGPSVWGRGLAIGGALALSLWTHSQAFLFPFLAVAALGVWHGLSGWRRALVEAPVALATAFVLAAWPYLRNVSIFGSPISDNPKVFAAPNLHWDDYFLFARGLDSLAAQIQYGVFKGWFSSEAFGPSFWFMTVGLALFASQLGGRKIIRTFVFPKAELNDAQRVLWTCSGLIVAYLAGVALSIQVGSELIRNERYLLILMPAVAICGGFGLAVVLQRAAALSADAHCPLWKKTGARAFSAGLAVVIVLQLGVVGLYYRWVNSWGDYEGPPSTVQRAPEGQDRLPWLLSRRPSTHVMQYIASSLPDEALILSLRPANMYYSASRMISYLDPRMLAAYEEETADAMAEHLKKLGVTHVLIPKYYLPPINNSALQQLVASDALTRLEYAAGGSQLYALTPEPRAEQASQRIDPGVRPWTRYARVNIGGRKAEGGIPLALETITENTVSERSGMLGLFHRDFSTVLTLGIGLDDCGRQCKKDLGSLPKVEGAHQYRLSLDLKGRGFVRIGMVQFTEDGLPKIEPPDRWRVQLGDLALVPERGTQRFVRRFETLPDARRLSVQVEHIGHSSVMIEQATLERLGPGSASNARAQGRF